MKRLLASVVAVFTLALALGAQAQDAAPRIGVVIMHGKGGSPSKFVNGLASTLEAKGVAVANIEMPWSGRREYDVGVKQAEQEVQASLQALRAKGANKLFVAGHSQGGVFAIYFGSQHAVDGTIAIAPGGSTGSTVFRERLREPLEQARQLVAQGKGSEKVRLLDYEFSKGNMPISTTPSNYLDWFDPDGAMNQLKSSRDLKATPVLYVAPTGDYPVLQRSRQMMFQALPANPLTKMIEPSASHIDAPSAAADAILAWMKEVTQKAPAAPQ